MRNQGFNEEEIQRKQAEIKRDRERVESINAEQRLAEEEK